MGKGDALMATGLPGLVRIRQLFDTPREPDVAGAIERELSQLNLAARIKPGQTVALTAGSRGIAQIDVILTQVAAFLRRLGASPFLFPAMGSHGGGTADGQRQVLESYGLLQERTGMPIKASMEVVEVGRHAFGGPVYLDKIAASADHVGVVARVKPHTNFAGAIESGLCKMMMIGMGKHVGALEYHRELVRLPWEPFVRSVSEVMLGSGKIAFGLGVVENADDETAHVAAALPAEIIATDERLLKMAYAWMPKLPFPDADLLIVDQIGKDVSGAGLDPNVLGGKEDAIKATNGAAGIRRIFVRDLTPKTHGNATGIGFADFTTDRLVAGMDYHATVTNCLTANRPEGAAIPVHLPTDRMAIEAAVSSVGLADTREARLMRIRDTLHLAEMYVSDTYSLASAATRIEVVERGPFDFGPNGELLGALD